MCLAELFSIVEQLMILLCVVLIYIYTQTKHMHYLNYIKITKLQNSLMLLFVFSSTIYTHKHKILDA